MRCRGVGRLFWSVWMLFFLISCAKEDSKDLLFLQEGSFSAEIEGELAAADGEGMAFSATVTVDRRGDAEIYEISYLTPWELEGITVTVTREKGTGAERITARLGTLSADVSHHAVVGWLSPLEALPALAKETPERLARTESGYRFVFPEDRVLTVDEKGLPLSLKTPKISFSVRKIQVLD